MEPTRPKQKKIESDTYSSKRGSQRIHVGLTSILEWIGQESGIDEDVRNSFDIGIANKIISIARYLFATDGAALPRIEGWQLHHELPYADGISENVYGALFRTLGEKTKKRPYNLPVDKNARYQKP